MLLTFDIETLPTNCSEVIEQLRATIKPPATHKKPDTIALWYEENAESALSDIVAKTSFDGMYGRIACIAWDYFDGSFATDADMTEREVIISFFDHIASTEDNELVFCGHNIAGFDLPFLKHRAIVYGIKPPRFLLAAMNAKPWDNCIADTMNLWDVKKMVGLSRLCRAFGIDDTDDMDGSMVAEMWKVNPERVIRYCKNDVELTKKVYKRIMFS